MYVRMHVCMYACMYACMHACMHVCMHACMYACMYCHPHINRSSHLTHHRKRWSAWRKLLKEQSTIATESAGRSPCCKMTLTRSCIVDEDSFARKHIWRDRVCDKIINMGHHRTLLLAAKTWRSKQNGDLTMDMDVSENGA